MADKGDDDEIDMKMAIRLAKMQPTPFAMAPGKSGLVFLSHKRKKPSDLALKVKKDGGESAKLVYGTMQVKGSELQLQVEGKAPPPVLKALKELLKSQGINLKPKAGDVEAE